MLRLFFLLCAIRAVTSEVLVIWHFAVVCKDEIQKKDFFTETTLYGLDDLELVPVNYTAGGSTNGSFLGQLKGKYERSADLLGHYRFLVRVRHSCGGVDKWDKPLEKPECTADMRYCHFYTGALHPSLYP